MNVDIAGLLAKASRAVTSAELLLKDGDFDAAVSRSYYAMFYAAEALLLTKGLSFSKHSAVIAAFGKEFAKTGAVDAKFHAFLIDAQEARNISDYQTVTHLTEEGAGLQVGRAVQFLAMIDAMLREQT
ncbi:MAG: HEPN domain-containing protein [Bryobacterales bacterium]|nr:HEPN domain-containing protein [Bryobacterales bacterium]